MPDQAPIAKALQEAADALANLTVQVLPQATALRAEFKRGWKAGHAAGLAQAGPIGAQADTLDVTLSEQTQLEAAFVAPGVTIRIVGREDQPSLTVEYRDEPPPSELTVLAQRLVTGYLAAVRGDDLMRAEPASA